MHKIMDTCRDVRSSSPTSGGVVAVARELADPGLQTVGDVNAKKPRGGKRAGAGRKAKDGATGLVQVGIRVRADQKLKLSRLGGSVWVRRKIDEEEES